MIVLEIFQKDTGYIIQKKVVHVLNSLVKYLAYLKKKNSTFVIMTQITNRKLLSKVLKLRNNISP